MVPSSTYVSDLFYVLTCYLLDLRVHESGSHTHSRKSRLSLTPLLHTALVSPFALDDNPAIQSCTRLPFGNYLENI